jgi:hypothetical protein
VAAPACKLLNRVARDAALWAPLCRALWANRQCSAELAKRLSPTNAMHMYKLSLLESTQTHTLTEARLTSLQWKMRFSMYAGGGPSTAQSRSCIFRPDNKLVLDGYPPMDWSIESTAEQAELVVLHFPPHTSWRRWL